MKTADDVLQRILRSRVGTLEEFRERYNGDPRILRNRQLAVILLGKHWGDSRDERIATKLDCYPALVEQALRLADEDEEFRTQLVELGFEEYEPKEAPVPQKPAEMAVKPKKPVHDASIDLLLRIGRELYSFDRETLLKQPISPSIAHVRRILMCIGHEFLSLDKQRVVELFECPEPTVSKIINESAYDYDHDPYFRKEIQDICADFEIPLDRRVTCK